MQFEKQTGLTDEFINKALDIRKGEGSHSYIGTVDGTRVEWRLIISSQLTVTLQVIIDGRVWHELDDHNEVLNRWSSIMHQSFDRSRLQHELKAQRISRMLDIHG